MQRVGFDEGLRCHGTKLGQGGWKYMQRLGSCVWHLIGSCFSVSWPGDEGEELSKECLRKLHPLCYVQMNAEADKLAKTADEKIGHGAGQMSLFTSSSPI